MCLGTWGDENGSVAGLICDVYTTDHEPFQGDPRSNLKRALKHMQELGFKSFNLGPEPEFFLFKLGEKKQSDFVLKYHCVRLYEHLFR